MGTEFKLGELSPAFQNGVNGTPSSEETINELHRKLAETQRQLRNAERLIVITDYYARTGQSMIGPLEAAVAIDKDDPRKAEFIKNAINGARRIPSPEWTLLPK